MKTLDEVIKAFEICIGYYCSNAEHDVCPYLGESDMGCMKEPEKDALHYLKEYKIKRERIMAKAQDCEDAEKRLQDEIAVYKEILTDYVALKQYWAEQQANEPLTWSELKQMKSKPVWIELLDKGHWKGWDVICGFYEDDFGDAMCTARLDDYYLTDHGKTWNAYRKERHELDQKAN